VTYDLPDPPLELLRVRGPLADPTAPAGLLIEVPHGADTQAHYDALAGALVSRFPARLDRFFHVNTDVGAWQLGERVARRLVELVPTASILAIRCAIPRTFVDTNRVLGELPAAGMTPGIPPYVTDPADHTLLRALHARYTACVADAYQEVCGAGGLALIPHTYAPRTVPIEVIDERIVDELDRVYQPQILDVSPLRPEIDLITHTPEGEDLSPPGLAAELIAGFAAIGHHAQVGVSYSLHPSTQGAAWSRQYPGQVICFEVRRDLVTHWEPFVEKRIRVDAVERLAEVVVDALRMRLTA
jgi:hypothetical protein